MFIELRCNLDVVLHRYVEKAGIKRNIASEEITWNLLSGRAATIRKNNANMGIDKK